MQMFNNLLRCTECKSNLSFADEWPAGGIKCPACRRHYPIVKGIPRFVNSDFYAHSFSYQWIRNRLTQSVSGAAEDYLKRKTTFTKDQLAGKTVLDVGCGVGYYTDVISRWGANVIAIDLSQSVEAAYESFKDRPNVRILQADIFNLPFREGSFDYIFSIGVLHHTPDPQEAFRQIARLLKPGGKIAIWVYAKKRSPRYKISEFYRKFTPKIPPKILYALSYIAVPMYYAYKIPLVGNILRIILPVSRQKRAQERILETFDLYSPKYSFKFTYPEVYDWFVTEGLEEIRLLHHPICIVGKKPDQKST